MEGKKKVATSNVILQEYEWALAQYFGAGVAACYRGTRIYDTDRTKRVVKKWVDFYKVTQGDAAYFLHYFFVFSHSSNREYFHFSPM